MSPVGTTVSEVVALGSVPTETPLVLEFAASRSQVTWGESVTLTWKLRNFDTVKLFPYGLPFSGTTGSYTFKPVRTQRYTLAGSFPSAQGGASLTITVDHSRRRGARH